MFCFSAQEFAISLLHIYYLCGSTLEKKGDKYMSLNEVQRKKVSDK
jgi:hypothetical protein